MIEKILISDEGEGCTDCISFGNADGKRWVMPRRRMRMAMNLYQPSSRKGRMVKTFLPIRLLQDIISKKISSEKCRLRLNEDLQLLFCDIWGKGSLDFALFGGTPGKHCKTILQLSRGNDILGYCKVTRNPEVASLFDGETYTLQSLHKKGIDCVPRALYRGRTNEGWELFVQSTVKTKKSKVCHAWSEMHDKFLETLALKTREEVAFEESDYFHTLRQLIDNIGLYPIPEKRAFVKNETEKILAQYTGKTVTCTAYHGDFTPWNTFAEDDKLYVFDWEYGKMTYPPGLDKCHFIIQTSIFEKHLTPDQIKGLISGLPQETVRMYLLDVISRFTIREQGHPSPEVSNSMRIWTELLSTYFETEGTQD